MQAATPLIVRRQVANQNYETTPVNHVKDKMAMKLAMVAELLPSCRRSVVKQTTCFAFVRCWSGEMPLEGNCLSLHKYSTVVE